MIDANALSNLQMLMNTGDGRQAVLAELLQPAHSMSSPRPSVVGRPDTHPNRPASVASDAASLEIQGKAGQSLRLLPKARSSRTPHLGLPEDIIARMDELSAEEKVPLTTFAGGLAYQYNNLFMAVVGALSIVMARLNPAHPAFDQLRECEEIIHNTSLLIRLLVDVFNRSRHAPSIVYPLDLSDREIGDRIFKRLLRKRAAAKALSIDRNVQKILRIVAATMATRLQRTLQALQSQMARIFNARHLSTDFGAYHQQIEIHLKRGLVIAEALLDYTTTSLKRKQPVVLNRVVAEAVQVYQSCFAALQIEVVDTAAPLAVEGQERLLHKMVLELLANANDACRPGGKVTIKLIADHNGHRPGLPLEAGVHRNLMLVVEDNGTGLPEDLGVRAFDPFTQAPDGRKRRGLGLATVAGIVRAHGGQIRYFNRPAGGLVVSIELPRHPLPF